MAKRLLSLRPITIFTFMAVLFGSTAAISDNPEIDMNGVLHLMGRHNIGHACPIDENVALTAAHVTDSRWWDDTPLSAFRYSNDNGQSGIALPAGVHSEVDLGWIKVGPDPVTFYEVSNIPPVEDDKIFWVEYNTKKEKNAFETERRESRVLRVVAGHIYMKDPPKSGASGGCLFNESGKVVGIVTSGWYVGFTREPNVGGAVGVWGKWLPDRPKSLIEVEEEDATSTDDDAASVSTVY
jgi:hypothetical protein